MKEIELTIVLHPSIPTKNKEIRGSIKGKMTIKEAILTVFKFDEEAYNLLVLDNDIRPGYLLIHDKTEIRTTKIIEKNMKNDMEIRIIPISHGG